MSGGNYNQPPAGYPQQGGQPQQPYGAQHGHAMKPHRGTVILVLGILGLVFCVICGFVAFFMAKGDLAEMKAGVMDRTGEGMTTAGYWLGLVSIILFGLGLIMGIAFVALGLAAGAASSTTY